MVLARHGDASLNSIVIYDINSGVKQSSIDYHTA